MHTTAVALLTLAALTGCVTTQPSPEPKGPPPGYAKMYVLRPAFSEIGRNERPTLYINDLEATQLAYQSYTDFTLKSGTYKLSVRPQRSESEAWTGEWNVSLEPSRTYFLAIWNEVEYRQETKAWYVGLPMPYVVTKGSSKALRYELVTESDALPVIRELKYRKAIARDFAPLP